MKAIKINKTKWADAIETLKETYDIYSPCKQREGHEFKKLTENELPDFVFFNSVLSPKHILFPQSQKLFVYSTDPAAADHGEMKEPQPERRKRVILGLRPCDARAFEMVRLNFDTDRYKDPYWLNLYQNTIRVGFACHTPSRDCFCTSAGGGPFNEEGLDVLVSDEGSFLVAKTITPSGEEWCNKAGFSEEYQEVTSFLMHKKDAESRITATIETHRLKSKDTLKLHDAPFWEESSFGCINCGICTYSCPTCWCFDLVDCTRNHKGSRSRVWDSCMYPLFTQHASGHNPRNTGLKRFRQRFMHKLKYFPDKYDTGIMCVGCGRCVKLCPSNIDIKKISKRMNEFGSDPVCHGINES